MTVAIVVPTLNCAGTIERALTSVFEQDAAVELVVVDGGSTDGTLEVLGRHRARLAHLVVEPDGGHYDAVNKGFALCRGEVMGWLGGDDFLMPGALALVTRLFADWPRIEWLSSTVPGILTPEGHVTISPNRPGFSRDALLDGAYGPGHSPRFVGAIQQEGTFWRRSLWDKAGGRLDTRWRHAADFELWTRFWRHAELFGLRSVLAVFARRPGQISAAAAYREEVAAILERARAEANHDDTPAGPDGLVRHEGWFLTGHPLAPARLPFAVATEDGPFAAMKSFIRMGSVA
ncbi:MAG: glycosyltransferase [Alphaproteobacteria bacterium]|nr:glycosyltransferase [Alphaproteobacteria bacterium]